MTPRPAAAQRKADLAQIHMAAAALKLIDGPDDSAYRAMLQTVVRVDSAGELDHAGRAAVLRHLRACGWQPVQKRARTAQADAGTQLALVKLLWSKLADAGQVRDASDKALRAFVRRQSEKWNPDGVGYDAPELLPPLAAQRVIEQLKRWCRRTGVEFR
ncbi:MAG: regulatory protein GemA [Xanthomonadales bacterium]|nr:regulatory protein GemA [Xanthomonadales bacterium]